MLFFNTLLCGAKIYFALCGALVSHLIGEKMDLVQVLHNQIDMFAENKLSMFLEEKQFVYQGTKANVEYNNNKQEIKITITFKKYKNAKKHQT